MRFYWEGPNPVRLVSLREKEIRTQHVCTEERPCEDTVRRQPAASQGERTWNTKPWPWASSLRKWEKINFCCSLTWSLVFCYGSQASQLRLYILIVRKNYAEDLVLTQTSYVALAALLELSNGFKWWIIIVSTQRELWENMPEVFIVNLAIIKSCLIF